jgi:hypothetical protein
MTRAYEFAFKCTYTQARAIIEYIGSQHPCEATELSPYSPAEATWYLRITTDYTVVLEEFLKCTFNARGFNLDPKHFESFRKLTTTFKS